MCYIYLKQAGVIPYRVLKQNKHTLFLQRYLQQFPETVKETAAHLWQSVKSETSQILVEI